MYVLAKGVVVVPNSSCWTGPWLGATRATCLQRVANRPILCHVLDALREAGVVEAAVLAAADVSAEIAACLDSEGSLGIEVRHLAHDPLAEDGEALLAAAEFVADAPCILHRADGLLGQPILASDEPLDMQARDVLLFVHRDAQATRQLRLVPLDALAAGDLDAPLGVACASVFGPGVLRRLADPARPAQLLDFAALAAQVAHDGGSAQVRVAPRWRHFAGDALDLLDINRAILDTLESEAIASPNDRNRFEGRIAIHPTACVTSSVVVGPVIIGAGALISDSYIGPHTSIAERVRIEGAELERSIVLADASVLHVGGRLVASIVGRQARIFRDFSIPRALRLQVGDGDQVALC
ncbi:MAG: hypothetical protein ACLP1Q_08230 [Solirubrobacteraceae bacterium]